MRSEFYDRFHTFRKDQLFEVALSSNKYKPEAIETAKEIIGKKGWLEEFNTLLNEQRQQEIEAQQQAEEEIIENAEYYKRVVDFKQQNNTIQVRTPDIPKIEGALRNAGIDFYCEDKNVGAHIDEFPSQTYFFKNEDFARIDQIIKEIELVTTPYNDVSSFVKFELKTFVIFIIVVLTLIGLATWLV